MSEVETPTRLARVVLLLDHDGVDETALKVVINQGSRQGVKIGDRFLVFARGPHIRDPETGEDLGELEVVRGRGEVVHVQDSLATLRSVEQTRTMRGKRITRQLGLGRFGPTTEEDIPPEQMPFDKVGVGDLAKRI
jgi:hypothetical protein